MKISAKINIVQNINILLFVHSLFLTSLTYEVKQGRPIDHQASTQCPFLQKCAIDTTQHLDVG